MKTVCVYVSDEDSDLPLMFFRYLLETFCMKDVALTPDQSQFVFCLLILLT